MTPRTLLAVAGTLLFTSLPTSAAIAGKPIYLGSRQHSGQTFDAVDHTPLQRLLARYVDGDGFVDYTAWHASRSDRTALQRYIGSLSAVDLQARSSRAARLAFWINAYNAVTLEGILREYPTSSIRNHTAKLVGYNIWKDLQLYVGGRPWSLDAMEHEVLRKMGEPRIHFAIVCASIGCPRLRNEAYRPHRLGEQLEANARDFFGRRQNFRYDAGQQTVYLSSILHWFGADFGPSQASQLQAIARWVPENARSAVAGGRLRVRFTDYNWQLNDQRRR